MESQYAAEAMLGACESVVQQEGETKGVTTMAKPREPWNIHPAKKKGTPTDSIKSEVEAKANDLIRNVLKPKHVVPPKKDEPFNTSLT
jgi:hypothetical protein